VRIVKGIVGVVLWAVGLLWIGQGVNLLPGSSMSGQLVFAVLGLVLVGIGSWLVFTLRRPARTREM
jgi:uncharacterized membrane protein